MLTKFISAWHIFRDLIWGNPVFISQKAKKIKEEESLPFSQTVDSLNRSYSKASLLAISNYVCYSFKSKLFSIGPKMPRWVLIVAFCLNCSIKNSVLVSQNAKKSTYPYHHSCTWIWKQVQLASPKVAHRFECGT